ncbi:hypothetical protein BGZ92_011206 [Podila epicladia]|nr:hypothetical protein BGZ92_011206 [Podila epicladia]
MHVNRSKFHPPRRLPHLLSLLFFTSCLKIFAHAGTTSAKLQCEYAFMGTPNLIHDPSCTLQPVTIDPALPPPPPLPPSPQLSAGPLSAAPSASLPWSVTPGWTYNPIFSCCSFTNTGNSNNATAPATIVTSSDLSPFAGVIDQGQQELEVSLSYFTSNSLTTVAPISDSFQVLVRFVDANGGYMEMEPGTGVAAKDLNAGARSESLLYYSFDAITMRPLRVPEGARSAVLQIVLPDSQTVFCFDYFAMRLVEGAYHPNAQGLVQKALIALGAVVIFNGVAIPVILFYGLPGWLWRSAPVNFFQKSPVVDHYVPLALFISTCQWIFNIIVNYLAGRASIVHSSQALWLIPLVLIGVFFVSAFAHWALFLCYNQVMQNMPRQTFTSSSSSSTSSSSSFSDIQIGKNNRRKWRAPILGLWAALCILLTRIGLVMLAMIEGSFWNVPIGVLLAVPETIALLSVEYFFIKTLWILARSERKGSRGMSPGGISSDSGGVMETGAGKKPKSNMTRSSSTTQLWPEQLEDPHDNLVNFSSYHHRAYVQSLLAPEKDLQEAAGSMYGHSTIGSEKTTHVYTKASKGVGTTASASGSEQGRYLGSTLNTTVSMSSSSAATDYTRHPTEYGYNVRDKNQRPRIHTQFSADPERPKSHLWGKPSAPRSRVPSDQTDMGLKRPPLKSRYSSREGFLAPPGANNNNNKLTWNSATTSYTTTSAAQPMTGASPTPSTWEYVVYPQRYIWPTIQGTYLLIARLPLRILVAVLTTLVLCFDVLLVIGAAEMVFAVPVSCLLGAMAYPGAAQFDNTMNVARAMHTVNLVLIVVILPTVICITVLHQIRMIQKYNWCLRLLRTGNYGFVPGGREYTQHLKHPVRFIGYTVGFGVVGLCFTIFLLFTLCTIVALLLVAATFRSSLFRTLGSRALAAFGISCLLVLVLWLVQMLVIKYRFRMRGSRFLISRQASFHHWEFFWAFFNIVFGAFAFCKRIVLSVLSVSVYSTRIDLCIMGGRFRPWDGGYSAFVGLVLADHVHNNPILLEFVQLLKDLLVIRRHPGLAHYFIEARQQQNQSAQDGNKSNNDNNKSKFLMVTRPSLNDIDEGEEARMDELVAASSALNGGPIKSGAASPEVSKVHHYYRMDPRVDRRQASPAGGGVGPASGSSEAPLLVRKQDGGALHVKVQDPAVSSNSVAVSEEQIRLKLSEAKLRSIRVRNRWFLYITLARNPSLCALRRTKAEDYLYPISQGPGVHPRGGRYGGAGVHRSHEEEELEDIQWDRED